MDSHLAGQISGVALVSQPHKKATIIGALAASGKHFPVSLRNRLISTGLKLVSNYTEKSNTSFVGMGIRPLGSNKTGFNLIIFH